MKTKKAFLLDMDGVLVRGRDPIPGAQLFIDRLLANQVPFMVITNNPTYTPRDLSYRLLGEGLRIPEKNLFTSALATAQFLARQCPNGKAFVIGESGLTSALYEIGYTLTSKDPEYVVLGETTNFNFEQISMAIRLIAGGAKFIATNPDNTVPSENGLAPACGSTAALIEKATGIRPYFIGKPNPFMMRRALNTLGTHSDQTVMVGDRMDTDVIAGMEAGMETVLVLSGVTRKDDIYKYPYRPTHILNSVAEIEWGE